MRSQQNASGGELWQEPLSRMLSSASVLHHGACLKLAAPPHVVLPAYVQHWQRIDSGAIGTCTRDGNVGCQWLLDERGKRNENWLSVRASNLKGL